MLMTRMGQVDIYQFLKDKPDRWFTSREISEGVQISKGPIMMALKILRESGEVEFKGIGKRGKPYQYKYKKDELPSNS